MEEWRGLQRIILYKCYHSVEFIRCQSNDWFSSSVSMDSIIVSDVISHSLSQVTLSQARIILNVS